MILKQNKTWKLLKDKLGPYTPALSVVLVSACVGASLNGYETPVFAAPEKAVLEEVKSETADESKPMAEGTFELEDGVYQGTGTGFAGDVTVAVQIKDKKIVSIDILNSSDDEAFFNRARAVIDNMIQSQSLEVDTVSGATYSSRGIINAVKNALTGEKDDSKTGASEMGGPVAGGTASVSAVQDASAYRDGTYYGEGTGFGGKLRVKVDIESGKIVAIEVVEHSDGSAYMQRASSLISAMIATQSTNVDTVSGATYSSVGIIQAVRSALSQAAVAENEQNTQVSNSTSESQKPETTGGMVPYDEGIYYGTAEGYSGDVTVAVVIQDHTIKAILVTEQEDDEAFFDRAMNVAKEVVKTQSTDVDTVSGATYSSNGLLEAIKNALKEAERVTKGGAVTPEAVNTEVLQHTIAEAEALEAEIYTPDSWNVMITRLEEAQAAMEATEQQQIDAALTNLVAAMNSLITVEAKEENSIYVNGIYTVTVLCEADEDEDFESYNLSAAVTIMNDKIVAVTDLKGDGSIENNSYIRRAANGTSKTAGVVPQIVETGNADGVDTVSRATCSSNAIVEICRQALEQAKREK